MVRRTGRTRRARCISDRRVLLAIIWPSDNRPARIGGSTILVATRDLARLANPVGEPAIASGSFRGAADLVERRTAPHSRHGNCCPRSSNATAVNACLECGTLGQPLHFFRLNARTENTIVQSQISGPQPNNAIVVRRLARLGVRSPQSKEERDE